LGVDLRHRIARRGGVKVGDRDFGASRVIASAVARPMPPPPPVTSATLPSSIPAISASYTHTVIPGRRAAANPEPMFQRPVFRGSGSAALRHPGMTSVRL
jgi:hypothetical protein